MSRIPREGSEGARKRLPQLLDLAHRGKATLITKRGVPYAAIMPVTALNRHLAGISIQTLRGSGKKLWGKNAAAWVDKVRDEWE